MLIDRNGIFSLLPHSGNMCLLDSVESWDNKQILCNALSHRDPDNPLRRDGRLSTVSLIEYGAQAMAVHGGILAQQEGRQIDSGYLVTLSDISLNTDYLSDIDAPMEISASRIAAVPGSAKYRFSVRIKEQEMASGCATVLLNTREST